MRRTADARSKSSTPEPKRVGLALHIGEWFRRRWDYWIPRKKMYQERRAVASLVVASTLLTCLLAGPASRIIMGHPLNKRSFFDLQCKGVYDKSIFARLDRICEDCYNLFREPSLHSLCRKNCFTTDYFKGCIDVLLLQDEMEHIQSWIKQLHGADANL
uniref:Ion transport peptide-like n=2 Tax=Lygus hesperus TaxID=30085 RepID=A0A0A9W7S4_LYGHE|nr:prepro-ion transport peptide-like variant 2 [Lygus hesperus]